MSKTSRISVVIATYNMGHLIEETIQSCFNQQVPSLIEIIVWDDRSTDNTEQVVKSFGGRVRYFKAEVNAGVGAAFNSGIEKATNDIIILMCADDLITTQYFFKDVLEVFENPLIGHVSRWYHQFIDGHKGAVRAWRGYNPLLLANNPSGLAFRKEAIVETGARCSNKMFIETTQLVSQVLNGHWMSEVLLYDAIAVRVHKSTSTIPGYWKKRKVSSAVLDQVGLGANEIATDFVSLIQIKRGIGQESVVEEIGNFVKVRPMNLINPRFWFWSIVALLIPATWAIKLPEFYRHRIGRFLTREIPRP